VKKRTAAPFYGKFQQRLETKARSLMEAGHRDEANRVFEMVESTRQARRDTSLARQRPMAEFNAGIKALGLAGLAKRTAVGNLEIV
jgi:hypothetical protein